jgi:hypothetical protein
MTNRTDVSPQTLLPVQVADAQRNPAPSLLPALACATLILLTGCGMGKITTSGAISTSTVITGRVHGGQQAVVGATVNLYAPGTGGYGSAPTLIATGTTDSNGSFTLPGPYPHSLCPSNSLPTYIVATGGNPGAGPNPELAMAALLPACSSLTASTFVWISEVTTVAAAYALAPFASISGTTTNIGTSSSNLLGITNALGPATNLADTTTGNAKGATSIPGIVLPTAEINTLANILAACVNNNATRLVSTNCATLFSAATPPGGVAPTDTFQAAIDIALNPGNNAAALFGLVTPSAPFQPTLSTAPTDFAVGIQYNGGPIANSGGGVFGIDIDALGNAWVTVIGRGTVPDNITEISPAGAILSGPNGYLSGSLNNPWGIAIDNSNNAWIGNYTPTQDIAVLPLSGTGATFYTSGSVVYPVTIAVDNRTTTAWIGNFGGGAGTGTTVSHITAAGVDATGSPYGSQNGPLGVAIDNTGNIWVANSDNAGPGNGNLTKFTPPIVPGNAHTSQIFDTGVGTYPFGVAIDNSGNVWVGEVAGVDEFSNSGTHLSPVGGWPQNVTTAPEAVIIDGLGRAWVSNVALDANGSILATPGYGSVTAFSPIGTLISNVSTPTSAGNFLGYTAAGTITQLPLATGMKIDPSGNLWITGGNRLGKPQAVTELIGIAAPVITPLSVASSTGKLGTRP